MRQNRSFYFIITLTVVLLGILSRKIVVVPLFIGDVLYAVMVYFGFRIIFVHSNRFFKIALPLLFCVLIELQQLWNAEWLVSLRNTTLGHYVLGQGFLWSDLVCYAMGIVIAFFIDTANN
ncbi:DUF2809 domain-containing protein [Flavobacterium sp. CYK-4]|uniref:ribosomal maturation YjgA family protein n=1 Tax=Flavobacterium lotistagni TaxID=2709660 RepID=UPI0014089D4A|nr:DUF2809 domain-containing protein [Flavobacterium lotistagni]NHM08226.1 DUF2809 domain-containing protein [Flavobacterium lotistagni]